MSFYEFIYYDLLIYTIGPCVRHTVSPQVVRAGHCCHSVLSCSLLQHAVAPSTSTGTRRLFSRVRCVTRVCPWIDGHVQGNHAAGAWHGGGCQQRQVKRFMGSGLLLQHARPVNPTRMMVSGCQGSTRDDRFVQRASRGIYLDT